MSKEIHRRKKARSMLGKMGYRSGGHTHHPDEAEDKALIKKMVKKPALKLKDGGCAAGGKPKPRADRLARGGRAKHGKGHSKVTVNVINAHPNQHPMAKPVPVPVPVGGPPPGGPGMAPPPPMGGPGDMPPGGPQPGLKRGGRARNPKIDSQRDTKGGMPAGHFKRGGRTKGYPIRDGSGGGEGRLEKIKAYGAKV